jgi:adenylate cyclase
VTALALAEGRPPEARLPGVAARMIMAWVMATGVPLLALGTISAWYFLGSGLDGGEVIGATLFLAVLGLTVGFVTLRIAARSIADPLGGMRRALELVERGDFDSRVTVNDGSEVGRLQAGFNRMASGLGEREKLREAFGAYVDPDLAQRVLDEGTDLEGEEVEVSILFMDVRGFTTFSESAGAREVVAKLNELFDGVVPVIVRNRGHANKFIGDGLLAVFGAPERLDDHARHAVAAAREIAALGAEDADGLKVGVGVHSGTVMAGTIGGGGRLDFTVIGDTVNTASRVESATRQTGDALLITEATLGLLGDEQARWVKREGVTLKGKTETVVLYAPAGEHPS